MGLGRDGFWTTSSSFLPPLTGSEGEEDKLVNLALESGIGMGGGLGIVWKVEGDREQRERIIVQLSICSKSRIPEKYVNEKNCGHVPEKRYFVRSSLLKREKMPS